MTTLDRDNQITYQNFNREEGQVSLADFPDECPICNIKINPVLLFVYQQKEDYGGYNNYEVLFKCTNAKCRHLFIGYYHNTYPGRNNYWVNLDGSGFVHYLEYQIFPKTISKISKQFSQIYNQSLVAEKNKLTEIAGTGYGKALEFLLKDYLISLDNKQRKCIEDMWLGDAIKKIDDIEIRNIAEKAAWLRNDESHYIRRFKDMNIDHLKDLISILVNFIDTKERAKKYIKINKKRK